MCKPMAHLLNWWSLHHHIKRQEEHNNMLLLPDIVLFCSYVIAPSKYNGQVKTLFSSLSLCAEIVIHFVPPCWMHGTQKAILSDSLPCLICYHETRWYTYTHSAFWSFWLYGKIQTYPLPKRYRQFFSWIPHDQISGICHCLSNVTQLRDGQTTFFIFPCGVFGG